MLVLRMRVTVMMIVMEDFLYAMIGIDARFHPESRQHRVVVMDFLCPDSRFRPQTVRMEPQWLRHVTSIVQAVG